MKYGIISFCIRGELGRRLAKFLVISCVVLTARFATSQPKQEMSPESIIAKETGLAQQN